MLRLGSDGIAETATNCLRRFPNVKGRPSGVGQQGNAVNEQIGQHNIASCDLDHRIAVAFRNIVKSGDVSALIVEAEAAAIAAGEAAGTYCLDESLLRK
jgi:hypothetical protein